MGAHQPEPFENVHLCENNEHQDMGKEIEDESKPYENDGEEKEDVDENECFPQMIKQPELTNSFTHKEDYYLHRLYRVCLKHDYIPPKLK